MNTIEAILKNEKLKITKPRLDILSILEKTARPVSSREILDVLKNSCDEATLFRTLKTLKDHQILSISFPHNELPHYELKKNDHSHQHHVTCTSCGEIEILSACCISPMIKAAKTKGFTQIHHRVELFGLCQTCTDDVSSDSL
jgi:Fur family ferric uptake transcriptional regulator